MSRLLCLLAGLFCANARVAQTCSLLGQVIDSRSGDGIPGATVLLKADAATLAGCATNQDGSFRLRKPTTSDCSLEVSGLFYRTENVRLTGSATNPAPLRVLLPGFGPYADVRGRTPARIKGHTDHVVPVVYGLPSAKIMAGFKAGKLYLGGCQLTGCDPHYYCLTHNKEL